MVSAARVLYWDTSAIVALLLGEPRHLEARRQLSLAGVRHLVSSLAWAEVRSVLARGAQEQQESRAAAGMTTLDHGPWTYIASAPRLEITRALAQSWRLRGADLWHLALAKSLSERLPGLQMLTFDTALAEAAAGEGLAAARL